MLGKEIKSLFAVSCAEFTQVFMLLRSPWRSSPTKYYVWKSYRKTFL